MGLKLEEKEETIVHNVLSLTPSGIVNIVLHSYKFSRRLTYALFGLQRYVEAIAVYDKAIQLYPNDYSPLLLLWGE